MNRYSASLNALLGVEQLISAELTGTEPTQAIETFRRTVDLLPNYWQPKRILGVALVRSGRAEEAIVVLTETIALVPPQLSGEPLLHRARAYAGLDRLDEAEADLQEALAVTTDPVVLNQIQRDLNRLAP